ncbi:hypothetical protein FQ087_06170 [Sporosarcina sp. ANT_H38]|uniref:hypothetical protein n=1 Tax=Sporosarcina sp. ANT_H38 TaxID=2597358 RepID=UPI0011F11793|nr:hypothetical protein [Sporosarcina sp. ANT_H38]KAA0965850.1 hypothetical protein FQ087_06170 [Sporosarcina sp. ANT_H38]
MAETNAEQLQRIQSNARTTDIVGIAHDYILLDLDFWFLIELAERAQEMESNCKALTIEWRDGVLENKRFREALDFYANAETYKTNVVNQWEPINPISRDGGEIALQALKGGVQHDKTRS